MNQLFQFFIELVLFRRKPQDLPASQFLMVLVLVTYFVVSVIQGSLVFDSLLTSFVAALADIIFMLFTLMNILYVTSKGERFVQTTTALAGGAAVITLIATPVQLLMGSGDVLTGLNEIGIFIYLTIIVWNLIFIAFILRHALDISMWLAMLAAFTYMVFSSSIITVSISGTA